MTKRAPKNAKKAVRERRRGKIQTKGKKDDGASSSKARTERKTLCKMPFLLRIQQRREKTSTTSTTAALVVVERPTSRAKFREIDFWRMLPTRHITRTCTYTPTSSTTTWLYTALPAHHLPHTRRRQQRFFI